MKHRLKGLYIDLIEFLQRELGFADYELHLFSREEYFRRDQTLKATHLNRRIEERLAINHRLMDEHIDFVIGELTNELDEIYEKENDEQSKVKNVKNLKKQHHIQMQSFLSMPISALFIRTNLCFSSSNTIDNHLFCSNEIALNNQSFFKVFNSTLWTALVGCYLSISLLMFLIVNLDNSFSNSNLEKKLKEENMNIDNKSTTANCKDKQKLLKSTLKDHYNSKDSKLTKLNRKTLKRNSLVVKEAKLNEDNRASSTLIELPDNNHLSSSTTTTNEHLVFCEQTGLRLVELDSMNHLNHLNLYDHTTSTESSRQNQAQLLSEHQLITMNNIAEQNQLDIYQLAAADDQLHLNEKHHQQQQESTLLQTTMPTIQNDNLILHSNLSSLNTIDTSTVTTIDHLNNNLNNLNDNIELVNNPFNQSVFNIDNNGQLSPYLNLDQIKDRNDTKENLFINTLITDKYPISNSLLVHSINNSTNQFSSQFSNQLNGQLNNQSTTNLDQFNQTKQYSPSFVQFQLLNDSILDHQSIIISSISSNSTRTTTLPSSSQQQISSQQTNNRQQQTIDQSNNHNLINDYLLSGTINHKNDQLKNSFKTASHLNRKSSMSAQFKKSIERNQYRSIELSACFWYTMAIACHQKVPFTRRSVCVVCLFVFFEISSNSLF